MLWSNRNNSFISYFLFPNCKSDGSCKEVAARALLRKPRSGCDVHGCDAAAPNAAMPMPLVVVVSLYHAQCQTGALYEEKQDSDEIP